MLFNWSCRSYIKGPEYNLVTYPTCICGQFGMDDLRIICRFKKIKRRHIIMASKSAKRLLVNKVIKTYVQAAYGITEPFGFFLTDLPIVFS